MSTYAKAVGIACSRKIHKSSVSDIWMIESETVKGKFYCVQYIEGELMCDCKAFGFSPDNTCKHILACSLYEGGLA